MPAVIPAVIGVAGGLLGGSSVVVGGLAGALGISTAFASGLISFATFALQAGASALFAEEAPKPRISRALRRLPAPADSRFVVLGEVETGGDLIWFDKASGNGRLYQLIVANYARSDSIVQHYLDGEAVTLDPDTGYVTSPAKWANLVRIKTRMGAHVTGFSEVESEFPYWSATDVGRGLTLVLIEQFPVGDERRLKLYPDTLLQWRGLVRGVRMPDPAGGADEWSQNAAKAVLWHLTDPDAGYGKDLSEIAIDTFLEHANVCNTRVVRKDGGSEFLFRCNGFVDLGQERRQVLSDLLMNCDADLILNANGKIAIRPFREPSVQSIGDRAVIDYEFQHGPENESRYNSVVGIWLDPGQGYIENSTPPRELDDGLARNVFSLRLPFCTDGVQAQMLAKRMLARLNPVVTGSLRTWLHTLPRRPGDHITLGTTDRVTDLPLRIGAKEIDETGRVVTMEVAAYPGWYEDWDPYNDEQDITRAPAMNAAGQIIPDPQGVGATVVQETLTSGTKVARIAVTFTPTESRIRAEIEHSITTLGEWTGSRTRAGHFGEVRTEPLEDGSTYDVRVRFIGSDGITATEWVQVTGITAVANTTPPGNPTVTATTGASGAVNVALTAPTGANYYRCEVRHGDNASTWATATFHSFQLLNQTGGTVNFSITGLTTGATRRVHASAQNSSGVDSGTRPSSTATVG